MKVRVKHHEDENHINWIGLIYQSDNVIILQIDLHTKRKEITAFGGATDDGYQSFWIGFNEVQMKLPPEFENNIIFASTSRYTAHVCIYKRSLLDSLDNQYDKVTLWEDEDD